MRSLLAFATLGLALAVPAAHAARDIDQIQNLNQGEFRLMSEDLGAALSYKALIPAEPLGTAGFDLGIEVTATRLVSDSVLAKAMTSNDSPKTLFVPKVHIHKGLPFGFDIGLMGATVPNSNISLWGAELRYAILKGGTASPAIGVRASYSQLLGVDQLDLSTTGVDVSLSKGFAFVTPYIGGGVVWVRSTPNLPIPVLGSEEFSYGKYFVGLNMNFAVINILFEADRTGEATSYGLKFGWRF